MEFSQDFPLSPRAAREATEVEIRRALQKPDRVAEWPLFGHTFFCYDADLIIMRVDGISGGDIGMGNIFYAWKYINPFSYMRDWYEIKSLPEIEQSIRRRL